MYNVICKKCCLAITLLLTFKVRLKSFLKKIRNNTRGITIRLKLSVCHTVIETFSKIAYCH
jgi:hypothetical protein